MTAGEVSTCQGGQEVLEKPQPKYHWPRTPLEIEEVMTGTQSPHSDIKETNPQCTRPHGWPWNISMNTSGYYKLLFEPQYVLNFSYAGNWRAAESQTAGYCYRNGVFQTLLCQVSWITSHQRMPTANCIMWCSLFVMFEFTHQRSTILTEYIICLLPYTDLFIYSCVININNTCASGL